jgi:hypothetical protein
VVVGPPPEFVAVTEPESATPGARVTVAVSPLDPGVEITGCLIAFPRTQGADCRRSGDRWSAAVVVPAGAEPGDLPLRWGVAYRTTANGAPGADNGTIDYRVLAPGTAPAPAFSVLPNPAAARAGERLTVSQASLVDGVTITGCSAGFTESAMAECRQTPHGWAADVVVPQAVQPGPGTVLWRLAYHRAGEAGGGATDGLVTFTVLSAATPSAGLLPKVLGILGRILLGAVVLTGLVAGPSLRNWARRRWDKWRNPPETPDQEDVDPDSVQVVPMQRADRMTVKVENPDAPPDHLIRITLHRPRFVVLYYEEVP